MNWIKQNKLLAGIAAVAIVGTIVFLWLAFSSMAATSKSVNAYKSAVGEITRLQAGALHPNPDNLEKKQAVVEELGKAAKELRDGLAQRYGSADGGDAATFGQRAQKRFDEVKALWEERKMSVPENFFLGMERYRQSVAAKPEATRDLDYQLAGIFSVVQAAAESGLTSIDKFTRSPVIGEEGGPPAESGQGPLRRYGMEIQCTGPESAVRAFVNAIAAHKQHFFAFRAIRLQNEVQSGPKREDVRKAVKSADGARGGGDLFSNLAAPAAGQPAGGDLFANLAQPAAEGAAAAEPTATPFVFTKPGVKDAYQFLGAEKVKAAIRLDLVIFQPAAEGSVGETEEEQ